MLPELVPLAHQYQVSAGFIDRLVGDFAAPDWAARDATGHDARWIVGHLAAIRARCGGMMGLEARAKPWHAAVGRGSRPDQVSAEVQGADLLAAFHAAHRAMAERWDSLTPADLAKPLGRTLPDGADTNGGALRFLAWHEAYHLGQLGLIRRLVGKPGAA
ncbi:MAG: DinB family protein [Planctomycetes bacterium]|nr:DinB family protein [Planctomycetota bacterium]